VVDMVRRDPGMISIGDPGPEVTAVIPDSACVMFDEASQAINANRFVGPDGCPPLTDTYYEWLLRDPSRPPPQSPPYDEDLVAAWRGWLEQADYVLFSRESFRVPWTPELVAWFDATFRPVIQRYATVYRKVPNT